MHRSRVGLFECDAEFLLKGIKDSQTRFVQEGERMVADVGRDAVIRFGNAASDSCYRITIPANGGGIPDCIRRLFAAPLSTVNCLRIRKAPNERY